MENEKSEFSEIVAEMSRFAGALAGAAVVGGKKVIRYINDLTTVETTIKPSADEVRKTDSKRGKKRTRKLIKES